MHVIALTVCNGKFCNFVIFYVILLPQHLQDLCLLLVKRNHSSLSEAESLSWSRPAHKVYRSPCSCVGSRVLASGCERRLPFPDRKQRFRHRWPSQTQNILESWLTFHYSTCGFYMKLENPIDNKDNANLSIHIWLQGELSAEDHCTYYASIILSATEMYLNLNNFTCYGM